MTLPYAERCAMEATIDAQAAEITRLREALQTIADSTIEAHGDFANGSYQYDCETCGRLINAARAALEVGE